MALFCTASKIYLDFGEKLRIFPSTPVLQSPFQLQFRRLTICSVGKLETGMLMGLPGREKV